jgi:hypothetical protein
MTKRRMQLLRPHAMEVTKTAVRSFPVASALTALTAVLLGSLLVRQIAVR